MSPYKSKKDRVVVDSILSGFNGVLLKDPGTLSYCIARLIVRYIQSYIDSGEKVDFSVYNSIIGVLEGNKLETFKRIVSPYEEKKMEEHGDVYNEVV